MCAPTEWDRQHSNQYSMTSFLRPSWLKKTVKSWQFSSLLWPFGTNVILKTMNNSIDANMLPWRLHRNKATIAQWWYCHCQTWPDWPCSAMPEEQWDRVTWSKMLGSVPQDRTKSRKNYHNKFYTYSSLNLSKTQTMQLGAKIHCTSLYIILPPEHFITTSETHSLSQST